MKKRLLAIALTLMLALTLLPVTAYATDEGSTSLGTTKTHCYGCGKITTFKILAYIRTPIASKPDPYCHWARAECTNCGAIREFVPDGDSAYHTGGTETPTCTTGKICEKCGDEYGILGHDWGVWQSNNDNKTHIRTCQREGCDAVDTENCGGDNTATCAKLGTCTDCGGQYYGGHTFPERWKWDSDPAVERDAEKHWLRCLNCEEGKAHESNHIFSPGNMYLKSAATCISLPVYYTNCSSCYYKGTDTYVYQWGQLDPDNHDGGTEVKDAKAATCTEKGYTGDTYCKGCGEKLAAGTDIPAGHDLKHVPASAATSRVNGNIEYWHCEDCGKYYADAEAKTEITQADTVIPKRRPSGTTPYDPDVYKELMDGKDTQSSVSSPKTGDAGIALYVGMAALSLTGTALYGKKRMK